MLQTRRPVAPWHARLLVLALTACSPGDRTAAPVTRTGTSSAPRGVSAPAPTSTPSSVSSPASAAPKPAAPPLTIATDPVILGELERRGASFAGLLEGAEGSLDGARIATMPRYASLLSVFDEDVRAAQAADPAAGVGMAKSHRLLDVKALRSPRARFELVGVSLRLDRAHVREGACGEARFVYRLAYATKQGKVDIASRLPATLALTFWLRDPGAASPPSCAELAARARPPDGKVTADWIVSETGPFGSLDALRRRFKSVESNLQVVRWPSTTRPDLAGHAEYVLRVFEPKGDALAPGRLENTPEVAAIAKDPGKREALARWVKDNLDAIDAGVALLPDSMLATKSVSVSPRGLARSANRPFRALLDPASLGALDLASRTHVRSPEALVRRLDQLSCAGCHQSRSVAGFHLLGEDRSEGANSVAVALSPHALSEVDRRAEWFAKLGEAPGAKPSHPPAERGLHDAQGGGGYGARCGLGDPGFASWGCNEGLVCQRGDRARGEDAILGTCLPKAPSVGDPCEPVVVSRDLNPARDRGTIERAACGPGAVCGSNKVGFPGGMCSTACAAAGKDGVCGGIPILTDFNACLGRNDPFERCIADNTRPAGVRGCDAKSPCREDYICARAPSPEKRGACMPPYFLFQLRVDGHPVL